MGFLPLLPLPCDGAVGVMPMAAMSHTPFPAAVGAPKDFTSHLKSHALPLLPACCTLYHPPAPLRAPLRYYDEEEDDDLDDLDDDDDLDDSASVFSMLSTGSSASTAPDDEEPPFEATDDATGETVTVYTSLEQAARYSAARAERERRSQEDALLAVPPSPTAAAHAVAPAFFHYFPAVPGAVAAPAPSYDGDDIDEDAYFSMG